MRRIVHLSDVRFGRTDPAIVAAVLAVVGHIDPQLVAISGDLTQRARSWQFREARAFLDALPCPQLVVPGNHDVPLYNVARRFLDPLGNYRRYITTNLRPVHADPEPVSRGPQHDSLVHGKGGTIRPPDLRHAAEALRRADADAVKIVVAHHPFEYPDDASTRSQKAAVIRALKALADAGADVFLTGHLHLGYTGQTAARYRISGRTAVIVEAGTATSTRRRGSEQLQRAARRTRGDTGRTVAMAGGLVRVRDRRRPDVQESLGHRLEFPHAGPARCGAPQPASRI